MADKQSNSREKDKYAILLRDFMVWLQVEGVRTPSLKDMGDDEVVERYLESMWYEIHNEVYINEPVNKR